MNLRLIKFTKFILDIMFFGGFLVLITLPFNLKFLGKYYSERIEENFFFMFITLAICGILGISIIAQLRRMMRTVIEGNCFVYKNVESLHKMALFSQVLSYVFEKAVIYKEENDLTI